MIASLALTVVLAAAPSPNDLLNRVQAAYKGGDLCASFEQTQVDKLRGKKKLESGKLWAKRDGRVRWSYEKPAPKDFVYDGKVAFFYEPEASQVTQFDAFEKSPLWNALRFLWGQGKLTETFDVNSCDKECPKAEAGAALLTLKPKQPLGAVEHVVLDIDTARDRVRRSIVYDTLGNRTEYAFKDVTIGCRVEPEKFSFKVPSGVSIIHATGEGAAP